MSDLHTLEPQGSVDLQREQLEERLVQFVMTGRALWQLWHRAPQQELLSDMGAFLEQWPLAAEHTEVHAGLALMSTGVQVDFQALQFDYADLFVGPDRLKAAPWGSVYLAEEQTTFGDSTLAVRAFYRQHGMEIETGEQEPEDHIGLMFAFIAWVAEQGLAMDASEPQQPAFCALRTFLEEHLLPWAPRLCELVQENAATDFYKGLGLLTAGVLSVMGDVLEAKPETAKLYR